MRPDTRDAKAYTILPFRTNFKQVPNSVLFNYFYNIILSICIIFKFYSKMCFHFIFSWARFCKKKYKENQEAQLPLTTVVIRWQFKRGLPGYDHATLQLILSRYGALRELRMLSPNSAMAVFDELTSACNVIQSHILGDPNNRLHCRWWHRAMENKSVYFSRKRIKVRKDPFLQHWYLIAPTIHRTTSRIHQNITDVMFWQILHAAIETYKTSLAAIRVLNYKTFTHQGILCCILKDEPALHTL